MSKLIDLTGQTFNVPWDLIPHLANEMAQKMIDEQGRA